METWSENQAARSLCPVSNDVKRNFHTARNRPDGPIARKNFRKPGLPRPSGSGLSSANLSLPRLGVGFWQTAYQWLRRIAERTRKPGRYWLMMSGMFFSFEGKYLRMLAVAGCALLATCPLTQGQQPSPSPRLDGRNPDERAAAMLRYVASCRPTAKDELVPKASAPCYAARLALNQDTEYAISKLDASAERLVKQTQGRLSYNQRFDAATDKTGMKRARIVLDPFDKAALVNTYFIGKSRIPKSTALKIRDYVALFDDHKQLVGYARGAWNYKLMLDASGFLAAEEWPELVDRSGLNASQIRAATRERLMSGFRDICRNNMSEYGATIYQGANLSSVRMIAEYARDEEIRRAATLTLDALLLDIACTWNQGYNIGSSSRAKYWYSTDTGIESMASTAAAAWIFFGAHRSIQSGGIGYAHAFWMSAPGNYRCPEEIIRVANERAQPFLHRSYVAAMKSSNVHRMTYHTPSYSVCSQWDQAASPTNGLYKESRRHLIKWLSPKASSTFVVCMENPYRPYNLAQKRANQLGYGENPFSQVMQHQGTLLGVYSVPESVKVRNRTFDYPYYRLYVPFAKTGSIVKRSERNGWIFCHNGSMLLAFRSLKPTRWGKDWGNHELLWCDARSNGWIVETSPLTPFAGGGVDAELDRFAAAILSRTQVQSQAIDQAIPSFRYRNLAGQILDLRFQPHGEPYTDQMKVDGKPLDFSREYLFNNPWVRQRVDSPQLHISIGGSKLSYDFDRWTRTRQ